MQIKTEMSYHFTLTEQVNFRAKCRFGNLTFKSITSMHLPALIPYIYIWVSYRLNVCVCPKHIFESNPQCDNKY